MVAAPNDLRLATIAIPIGTLLLGLAVPLRVQAGTYALQPNVTISHADLADAARTRALLDHGPGSEWKENLRLAVETGAWLATIPVAYFLWAALSELPFRTSSPTNLAFLTGTIGTEVGRWLGTAGVFGLLHRRLPGRLGPVKALYLAATWFATAGLVELASRWTGAGTGRGWMFPGLQLLLFLVALGTLYDYRTMRAAHAEWSDMQVVYGIESTRKLLAAAVPVLLAVLTIVQQLASGTGLDFVRGIIENAPKIVPPAG